MDSAIEKVARIICKSTGNNPDYLEPGDRWDIDDYCANGDPGHFMWREYIYTAKQVIKTIREGEECQK